MKKENRKNIIIYIFIFIAVFSTIIINPINDLDELWNYNTARAISEGLIPYKEISMITTPLLPMITAVFLKLITNELFISRILVGLLGAGILFTLNKILQILIKEENTCLICTALIWILLKDVFCIDYNFTVLLIALIILYRELKIQCKNELIILDKKQDLITRYLSRISNMYKAKHRNDIIIYCSIV